MNISNNKIHFPGNGTSGDGMTLSSLSNVLIDSNQIIGGSCYGIALGGKNGSITFNENLISDDITSALYFSKGSTYNDVIISNNLFLNNDAWAIAFLPNTKFRSIYLYENILHKGKKETTNVNKKNALSEGGGNV